VRRRSISMVATCVSSSKKMRREQKRAAHLFSVAVYAIGAFLLGTVNAWSQEIEKTTDQSTIRANVSLVTTPVVVSDGKGKLVMGLSEKDFRVFDNGVEQTLEAVELSEAPLSVALVVERSSRIEALLPALQWAGLLFTQKVMGENGEAAVIGYDDGIVKLLDFTGDAAAVEKTFADLAPGTSGANLYDAMSEAVNILRNVAQSRRRVIITLAEAFDNGSKRELSQLLHDAQVNHITIYSIGLSTLTAEILSPPRQGAPPRAAPQGIYLMPPVPGSVNAATQEILRSGNINIGGLARPGWGVAVWKTRIAAIAAATGGRYLSTGETSLEAAIDHISEELYTQYTLGYRRTGTDTLGYHKIKIEVVGQRNQKARYRTGYYLFQP
jgi:VWFA-related protein